MSENQVKHLEMIQAVIGRLGNSGFLVKGSATTLVVAVLGLAVNNDRSALALVALVPVLASWALDTYLLRSERLFRELYEQVRLGKETGFLMNATAKVFTDKLAADRRPAASWRWTLIRPSLSLFYGALATASLLVACLLRC